MHLYNVVQILLVNNIGLNVPCNIGTLKLVDGKSHDIHTLVVLLPILTRRIGISSFMFLSETEKLNFFQEYDIQMGLEYTQKQLIILPKNCL